MSPLSGDVSDILRSSRFAAGHDFAENGIPRYKLQGIVHVKEGEVLVGASVTNPEAGFLST